MIYNNSTGLIANANVPSCFFCSELSTSINKASGEFTDKQVEIFKILSFEFALKRIKLSN